MYFFFYIFDILICHFYVFNLHRFSWDRKITNIKHKYLLWTHFFLQIKEGGGYTHVHLSETDMFKSQVW